MKIKIQCLSPEFQEVSYSQSREYALAADVDVESHELVICALRKAGDEYLIMGTSTFVNFQPPAEVEFVWGGETYGEVVYYKGRERQNLTFDFAAGNGTLVVHGAWFEGNHEPNAGGTSRLPVVVDEIHRIFFHTKGDWAELTVKKANGYFEAIDDENHDYSLVVETESGQCTVYAYSIKDPEQTILGGILIPPSIKYPFKVKINHERKMGAFSINDDAMIGVYDFNSLDGVMLLPNVWDVSEED